MSRWGVGLRGVAVVVDGVEYPSVRCAADRLNVSRSTLADAVDRARERGGPGPYRLVDIIPRASGPRLPDEESPRLVRAVRDALGVGQGVGSGEGWRYRSGVLERLPGPGVGIIRTGGTRG